MKLYLRRTLLRQIIGQLSTAAYNKQPALIAKKQELVYIAA